MLVLNDKLYIAKGAERKAFLHPEDSSKLIKVEYHNHIGRNQNDLDIYYYAYLKSKNVSYKHIPNCYGKVDTNMGRGVIFDIVIDYNNMLSKTFENIIIQKIISKDEQIKLLKELQIYLKSNFILFGDVVLSNILCQEYSPNRYRLIIVDGLGARRFGFKLWFHTHSKLFTKYRVMKQWKKLVKNYDFFSSSDL